MILEFKHAPTSEDAPPSYDDAALLPSPLFTDKKSSTPFPSPQPNPDLPTGPTPGPSQLSPRSPNFPKPHRSIRSNSKGKGPASWFNFSSSRTTREVRSTVLGLIRDLIRQHQPTDLSASLGILESCAEACTAYSLSLPSLLQERSIEGHTPLYWAIIKRPPEPACDDAGAPGADLLTTLLTFSAPLAPETISEIRYACLVTSDQALFQRLRQSPEFAPLSGTDEMLLGASMPPDEITVEDVPGDEGAFAADFGIVLFQQRMRVSKRVALEFIARGRMWCLAFSIAAPSEDRRGGGSGGGSNALRPGAWCLSLSLFENSPPTWIDSRLLIKEPARTSPPPSPSLIDAPIADASPPSPPPLSSPKFGRGRLKPKPTINLRLKSGHSQLRPPGLAGGGGRHRDRESQEEIVVSLDESLMGSSLQYAGSSYIGADGTLRARLEARLAKPEAECIVC